MATIERSWNLPFLHDDASSTLISGAPVSAHKLQEIAMITNAFLSRPQKVLSVVGYCRELLPDRPINSEAFASSYEQSPFFRYALFGEVSNTWRPVMLPRTCPKPPGKTTLIGKLQFVGDPDLIYNFQLLNKLNPTPQSNENNHTFSTSTADGITTVEFEVPCLPEEGEEIGLAVQTFFDPVKSDSPGFSSLYLGRAFAGTDGEDSIFYRSGSVSQLHKAQHYQGKWLAVYRSSDLSFSGGLLYALAIKNIEDKLVRNDAGTAYIWEYNIQFAPGQTVNINDILNRDVRIYYMPRFQLISLQVYTKEEPWEGGLGGLGW